MRHCPFCSGVVDSWRLVGDGSALLAWKAPRADDQVEATRYGAFRAAADSPRYEECSAPMLERRAVACRIADGMRGRFVDAHYAAERAAFAAAADVAGGGVSTARGVVSVVAV